MIDMHSHILFGVDDGPADLQMALQLLEQAVKEGITDIISTSHSCHPQYDVAAATVKAQVAQLQQEINDRQLPLTLHIGQEVRLVEDLIERLQRGDVLTLAQSSYLLLELPSSTVPKYTRDIVIQLQAIGITPIIAHPERNKMIAERPSKLEELIREGAVSQITAGSLAGHFGTNIQKLSLNLVKANLVHTYGSDVHHLTTRPFLFDAGLTYLEKNKQLDAVDVLLENNARIVENKGFILYEPEPVQQKKWWQLFSR